MKVIKWTEWDDEHNDDIESWHEIEEMSEVVAKELREKGITNRLDTLEGSVDTTGSVKNSIKTQAGDAVFKFTGSEHNSNNSNSSNCKQQRTRRPQLFICSAAGDGIPERKDRSGRRGCEP